MKVVGRRQRPSGVLEPRSCGLCGAGMLPKRLSLIGDWFWWCLGCKTSEEADQGQVVDYLRQVHELLGIDLGSE